MKVAWPWTEEDWKAYLIDEFHRCRAFPGWPDILSCHDEEDRAYFGTLEEMYQMGQLEVEKPPLEVEKTNIDKNASVSPAEND